jgi:hypothetical protein
MLFLGEENSKFIILCIAQDIRKARSVLFNDLKMCKTEEVY